MRNVSEKYYRENQNAILYSTIFFFENRAIYEIMGENIVHPDSPYMRTLYGAENMRFAWRLTKARLETHTLITLHVMAIALPRQKWLRERASMSHAHSLSCQFLSQI